MIKVNLSEYKNYKQYFLFYDVIIKQNNSNKEMFLESVDISPSSYRRAKNAGNKIGLNILNKLNCHFQYEMVNKDVVEEIETMINKIYFNIYYKKRDSYNENLNWLNEMLDKRYIIYPILLLFKLLLIMNSNENPKNISKDYEDMFEQIKKFYHFFNKDLKDILEVVGVAFVNDITNIVLSKNYSNELSYHTLSTKCILQKRYIEAIYFSEKAKQSFIKEENFRRVYSINLNLMSAYNYLEKYYDCYMLSQKQMISLESHNIFEFEYLATQRHYVISCLGLGKYNEILNALGSKKQLNKTELCCYFISKYKTNKKEYNQYYNMLKSSGVYSTSGTEFLELLNKFIIDEDKKSLTLLENHQITNAVIEILKKCKM